MQCPASELAFAQLRLLVASRMQPLPEAHRLLSSMSLEEEVVAGAARLPAEPSRIYATTTQEVVLRLQQACGVQGDVDVSGWRTSPNRTTYASVANEEDALTLELLSSLLRDLFKV